MPKVNYLIFAAIIAIFSACSTEKRAQRHLRRAISLNPNIVSEYQTDTVIHIDTVVNYDDTLIIKEKVTDTVNVPIKDVISGRPTVLLEDSNVVVMGQAINGLFKTVATIKSDTIFREIKVPVEVEKEVRVPGKTITVEKKVRGFWHYSGIAAWIMIVLCVGVYIIRKVINPLS